MLSCIRRTAVLACVVLTGALSPAGAAQAGEAAATAGATSVVARTQGEVLEELDEVTVHSKRLLERIAEAEDDFYDLFNKLNKDDRYDTTCSEMNVEPENPLTGHRQRICMPGFVKDAMADWAPFKARCQPPLVGFDEFDCLDRNRDGRISYAEASVRAELEAAFMTADEDRDNRLTRTEFPVDVSPPPALYQPPPPDLVLMEGTKGWYEHMMKMVRSDPTLQDKAGKLDELYLELQAAIMRQDEMKKQARAMREKAVLPKPPR